MEKNAFDHLFTFSNKYKSTIEKYSPNVRADFLEKASTNGTVWQENQHAKVDVKQPQIVSWDYLPERDVEALLKLKRTSLCRRFIEDRIPESHPRGFAKLIFRELMYSVLKFCRCSGYTVEQSGTVLSQFYLTHTYFTSSLDLGPHKVYDYFKEFQLHHSLPFPPDNKKLFDLKQAEDVMAYFCKIYLRNMPLLRILCLPNFALSVGYKLESDFVSKKKGKKDKKSKKGKKDKKSKKGKKK